MNILLFKYRCVCVYIYIFYIYIFLHTHRYMLIHRCFTEENCSQAKNFTDLYLSKQIYIKSCSGFIDVSWYQSIHSFLDWVLPCTLECTERVIPKTLWIQSSHCNDFLTAICIFCSSLYFTVIELVVLQEKTGKRRQLYARRQNQEHWLQQMKVLSLVS